MSTVSAASVQEHRVTIPSLRRRTQRGEKIAMLTAYDYTFAAIFDASGIDIILVGDSLGNVVQGLDTTLPGAIWIDGRRAECVACGERSGSCSLRTTRWRSASRFSSGRCARTPPSTWRVAICRRRCGSGCGAQTSPLDPAAALA